MKIVYKITKEEAIAAFKLQKEIPINAIVEIEDAEESLVYSTNSPHFNPYKVV